MAVTAACPCQWQQRLRPSAGDCTGSVSAAQNPRKNGEAGCREAGGSMECLGNGWRWRRPSTRCLVGGQRLGASSDRGSVAGGCVAGLISRGSGTSRSARSARCGHALTTQTWRRQLRVRERCAPRMAPEEEKMTKRSPLDFPAEWERPGPSRRPDIFPQFTPMKTPLPQPLPGDPPEKEDEDEEDEDDDPEPEEEPEPEE